MEFPAPVRHSVLLRVADPRSVPFGQHALKDVPPDPPAVAAALLAAISPGLLPAGRQVQPGGLREVAGCGLRVRRQGCRRLRQAGCPPLQIDGSTRMRPFKAAAGANLPPSILSCWHAAHPLFPTSPRKQNRSCAWLRRRISTLSPERELSQLAAAKVPYEPQEHSNV